MTPAKVINVGTRDVIVIQLAVIGVAFRLHPGDSLRFWREHMGPL